MFFVARSASKSGLGVSDFRRVPGVLQYCLREKQSELTCTCSWKLWKFVLAVYSMFSRNRLSEGTPFERSNLKANQTWSRRRAVRRSHVESVPRHADSRVNVIFFKNPTAPIYHCFACLFVYGVVHDAQTKRRPSFSRENPATAVKYPARIAHDASSSSDFGRSPRRTTLLCVARVPNIRCKNTN